jgi:hypothetical protein
MSGLQRWDAYGDTPAVHPERLGPSGLPFPGFPREVRVGFVVGLEDTLRQLQSDLRHERGIYLTGHGAWEFP